jgi:hypothetical protein
MSATDLATAKPLHCIKPQLTQGYYAHLNLIYRICRENPLIDAERRRWVVHVRACIYSNCFYDPLFLSGIF